MRIRRWVVAKWCLLPLAIVAIFLIGLGRVPRALVRAGRQIARPWAYCELRARGWSVVGRLQLNRHARRAKNGGHP